MVNANRRRNVRDRKAEDRHGPQRLRTGGRDGTSREDLLREKLADNARVMGRARRGSFVLPHGHVGAEIHCACGVPRLDVGVSMAVTTMVRLGAKPAGPAVVVKRRRRGHRKQVTGQYQPNGKTSTAHDLDSPEGITSGAVGLL
jgi:hypothetical protein